jgi:hypothetical protein
MDNNTFLDTRQNLHTTSASDQFLIPKTFKSMDNNTFLDTRQNLHTTSCLIQLYLWRNSVLGQMEKLSIKCFFLTWCFSSYCEQMHITLHVHHWNKILKIWWKGEKTDVWQSFFPIFVPKVSCFVRNQWQWCPSKVSTNCMHYDDSDFFVK